MIKKLNPEMTDELLAYLGRQDEGIRHCQFRRHPARRHRRHERRAGRKLLRQDGAGRRGPPDIDFRKAYTLRFINKGVGLDLRPKN